MRSISLAATGVSGALLSACLPAAQNVQCIENSNCDRFTGGACHEAASGAQWCSYPDPECRSGYRYSDLDVGDGLSGRCVEAPDVHEPPPGMGLVPAGPFLRGCNASFESCPPSSSELPFGTVTLRDYYIDFTEVPQIAYQECITAGACSAPPETGNGEWNPIAKPLHPVTLVTWQEAAGYCGWRGKRLPTEAEWEKAARGVNGSTYPWGNAAPNCSLANYQGCPGADLLPVGSQSAGESPFRIQDMAGNVMEFVQDWHDDKYYATSPTSDPQGPSSGEGKVLRGGCWDYQGSSYCDIGLLRSAQRGLHTEITGRFRVVGFRCAWSS